MTTCVPIKELKNTAEFARVVREAGEPVVVTKNGTEAFVSMTPEQYEALRLEASRVKLYEEVEHGENDIRAGRTVDAHGSIEQMRSRYGL